MQTVRCSACPLRKKNLFVPFTDDEVAFMEKFKVGELTVDAGTHNPAGRVQQSTTFHRPVRNGNPFQNPD